MNTSNSTLSRLADQVAEDPHRCDLDRCVLDPTDGTRVHISTASAQEAQR